MFWLIFGIFLTACLGAGATGGLFPPGRWYRDLRKPSWTPPDWVFPLTWMILYVCMALAAARVAMLPGNGVAMALWAMQIAFNALWTPVFFGLKRIRMGMAVIGALWLAVLGTLIALWQVDTVAGLLFVPYLVWVTIASALNAAVWRLNPGEARAA
ncbi:TspO/MBR family protein [Aestuariivita sp.]|jgi:tryptophan-rich sensory protein|uniref:tryptophan-rich sensory protein TspO n=1 Tax=Aestuariivita sp. TaxID=1872407 RepID=UPI0021739FED|nr:TspO/MBR family protein [Aestuariivita sp.]MCE8007665.1 tryptophan-rich sensory protein [Aestuariivita sp.]